MEKTTRRTSNEKWETGLLWKDANIKLPESRSNAARRLYCLEKKFRKDADYAELYNNQMESFINKGYAKKLTDSESLKQTPKTWYLPHFGVLKKNKLRIVLDAASKSNGICLNDALLKGPDLFNSMLGILWNFRQRRIGFAADIQEMFPQIRIISQDHSSQRFLWRESKNKYQQPDTYEIVTMMFGTVCSPSSAQEVRNRNAEEFRTECPNAVNAIQKKHYMDDYLDSADNEEEANEQIANVIRVHKAGGFKICKWTSSSSEVLYTIPYELRGLAMENININIEARTERVLGLHWNPEADTFEFDSSLKKLDQSIIVNRAIPTKRQVLQVTMSIFDPIGFLAHYLVHAKVLLQEIWRSEIGWDDLLTESLNSKWQIWLDNLENVKTLRIPRCYSTLIPKAVSVQIHAFADASEKAYAAVVYLRVKCDDHINVAFISAKSRVAPLKTASIPRLELQAAVLATRLVKSITEEIELTIEETYYWSDSKTVICWIQSDARNFKQFVSVRIGEILESTEARNWRWIPTKENVADDATKWKDLEFFDFQARWFQGPPFLKTEEVNWPAMKLHTENLDKSTLEFVGVLRTIDNSHLPDVCRFSNYMRLIRSTAWILKFIRRCREKREHIPNSYSVEFIPSNMMEVEKLWWKKCQSDSFAVEISALTRGEYVDKASMLYQLSPYLDKEGILRIKGRIENAHAENDVKRPVILFAKHPFTKLLIHSYHIKLGHNGQEQCVNEIRQKFWIPNIRNAVRRCWNECQHCKNSRSKPCIPEMGQLPPGRLQSHEAPFSRCGMDYFGPMTVKIGRRQEKRYGVLFTCMTTRAVHLEIAQSLSTDSAIMAIRRMISRRGQPFEIWSDNGTNLRGSDKELKNCLKTIDQSKLTEACTSRSIRWNFNPPAAPHMGGCWERLVRSVKTALKATLKEKVPKEEVLQTLFAEAENIVNSRPLTYVSLDAQDDESLTPNHFLIGKRGAASPGNFSEICLRRQWKIAQQLSDSFWKLWRKEYLPTLTRRTKWYKPEKPLEVGDIVIVVDDTAERNAWPKGIIMQVLPDKKQNVRSAEVKISGSNKILRRPVSKLCKLDVKGNVDSKIGSTFGGKNVGATKITAP